MYILIYRCMNFNDYFLIIKNLLNIFKSKRLDLAQFIKIKIQIICTYWQPKHCHRPNEEKQ